MMWIAIGAAGVLVLALAWWWLSRPLWYDCRGTGELENFLRDLVSLQNPVPEMVVVSESNGQVLTFLREYTDSNSAFQLRLHLVVPDPNAEKVKFLPEAVRAEGFSGEELSIDQGSETTTIRVDFGVVAEPTLAGAAQMTRILLTQLGYDAQGPLRVRYGGAMDPKIVGPALDRIRC